ncbi:MAG: sulfatase-like hydrolase/transferase [Propioniciclava sp.]
MSDDEDASIAAPRAHRRCARTPMVIGLAVLAIVGALTYAATRQGSDNTIGPPAAENAALARATEGKAAYLARVAATGLAADTPSVIIVHYDDLGYGDVGFLADTPIATPNLDALAADGVVLTNYHAPSAVCTPSRAGLLTGRLGPRADVPAVLFPSDGDFASLNEDTGASPLTGEEITLPDTLHAAGYRTAMIGKWHLGDGAGSRPTDFGFDSFLGSFFSHDLAPFVLYRDGAAIDGVDVSRLDTLYTDEAVRVVNDGATAAAPFLLYLAHHYPHEPLTTDAANLGRSDAGRYGDVVEGLDNGIGRIVDALAETEQLTNTIIIVTSDNGPWYQGSPGEHRGRKGSVHEGGFLVPFLAFWPAGITGGRTVDTMTMGTDVLPTVLDWLELPAPTDRILDGSSMAGVIDGTTDTASEYYYFYSGTALLAVSDGRFKYHAATEYVDAASGDADRISVTSQGPWLFDLDADPGENYDVSERYPQATVDLQVEFTRRVAEMRDNPRGWRAS